MPNPLFKRGRKDGQTFRPKLKKNLLKNHQCEPIWQASVDEFGTTYGQFVLAWDCMNGWTLARDLPGGPPKQSTYRGQGYNNLRECPFCHEALKVINEVTIQ